LAFCWNEVFFDMPDSILAVGRHRRKKPVNQNFGMPELIQALQTNHLADESRFWLKL